MREHIPLTDARQGRTQVGEFTDLRKRLASQADYIVRFEEACALWDSLFLKHRSRFPVAEAYRQYIDRRQFDAVEETLNQLIFGTLSGTSLPPGSFLPTARESLLLLSAIWLQPVGLMWGLFESEIDPIGLPLQKNETELAELGNSWVHRSARYLRERWSTNNGWSDEDKDCLAKLCVRQQAGVDISSLDRAADTHKGLARHPWSVNLQKLSALLRLANVCCLRKQFCSLDLKERIRPGQITGPDSAFLGVTDLIQRLDLDHGSNSVIIEARIPPPLDYAETPTEDGLQFPLTLDVRPSLEYLRAKIESIVQEVSPFLLQCASTRIKFVRLDQLPDDGTIHLDEYIPRVWALQMASTTCATEGSCCFALVLHRMLQSELRNPNKVAISLAARVRNKCDVMKDLQPFNVMATRLARQVRETVVDWSNDTSPPEAEIQALLNVLEGFLNERQDECVKVGANAAERLQEVKTAILYGVSRNVMKTLEEWNYQGRLLVVPINTQLDSPKTIRRPEAQWSVNQEGKDPLAGEDARMQAWCMKRGIELDFVDERMIPTRIRALKGTNGSIAFLAGARSVIRDDEQTSYFSTIGNLSIAQTIRRAGGKVVIIAERGKVARMDDGFDEAVELRSAFKAVEADPNAPVYSRVDELILGKDVDEEIIPANTDSEDLNDEEFREFRRHWAGSDWSTNDDGIRSSLPVEVYLPDAVPADADALEQIQQTIGSFLRGFEFTIDPEKKSTTTFSSWRWNAWFKSMNPHLPHERNKRCQEMREAFEKDKAEFLGTRANEAAQVLEALEGYSSAIARLGDVVIVKAIVNGDLTVLIDTLSAEAARKLDENLQVLADPLAFLEFVKHQACGSSDSLAGVETHNSEPSGDSQPLKNVPPA